MHNALSGTELLITKPEEAPIVLWRPPENSEHVVMFYDDDSFLLDSLVGFIGSALRAGQRGIVVATPEHLAGAAARLALLGISVDEASAAGQYVARDARETLARFMVDGSPCAADFEAVLDELLDGTSACAPPRIFGEMVALLAADGAFDAALALESLWNQGRATRPFSLLCGYPMALFGANSRATDLTQACQVHSAVVPCESYTLLTSREDRLREIAALQQKAASLEFALAAEREARDAAEAALRVRDEFLSMASHELRTPITVVGVQAQALLRRQARGAELDLERITHAMRTIETQTDKLARLVSQLLDVTRLDSGKLPVEPVPTDIAALIRSVASVSQPLSEHHPILVTAPEQLIASADPLRLEQVLMNLFDNAMKYSPDGTCIELELLGPTDGWIEIRVRDHGPGIEEQTRAHIFDRFFQAEPGTNRGLGLGLYVCRTIVELHGGELAAECPPDGGTCFCIRLPQ
jgi:signal transduction histidine kinase